MTDLTLSPSAKRFASLLEREYCVWLPSPSLALLCALVTGKGRPKRLLTPEHSPAFVSNIGLITGAAPVKVHPREIEDVLETLLGTDGLTTDLIWGVATHRGGKLSPTDWLSRCAALKIPTVELCLGSLSALAKWSPSPATFTIVDLDSEESFSGVRLTALLTSDRAKAAKAQKLCLPGSEAQDYVLDAWPRGLAHDEKALMDLVERVIATRDVMPLQPADVQGRGWKDRALLEEERWRTRLEEAEGRHTQDMQAAAARESALQGRFETQRVRAEGLQARLGSVEAGAASQSERDSVLLLETRKALQERDEALRRLEARLREVESDGAELAELLDGARAELINGKTHFERTLASTEAEREALTQKLARTERERDLAVADAARQDELVRRTRSHLQRREQEFEKAAADLADREAGLAQAAREAAARQSGEIARMDAETMTLGRERSEALRQKAEAEGALASLREEKEALEQKLAELDAELGEALADAAQRSADQRAALEGQGESAARLEKEMAVLIAREGVHRAEREELRRQLSGRIAALEGEKADLAQRLAATERSKDHGLGEAAGREEMQRAALLEQKDRSERYQAEAASLKERESRLSKEWEAERAELSERIRRLEVGSGTAQKALSELLAQKTTLDAALAQERAETRVRAERVAEAERSHALRLAAMKEESERRLRQVFSERDELSRRLAQAESERARAVAQKVGHDQGVHVAPEGKGEKEDLEKTLASLRSENEAAAQRIADLEEARDRLQAELNAREAAQRAALERERERQGRFEAEAAARTAREAELTDEWALQRAEFSDRIVRLEAAAAAVEKARKDIAVQKAEADQNLAAMRERAEQAIRRLAVMEKEHVASLAEVARRENALRLELEAGRRQGEQIRNDAAALAQSAERPGLEAVVRSEWAERIRVAEEAAASAADAHADLLTRRGEQEKALEKAEADRLALVARLGQLESQHADLARREAAREAELIDQRKTAESLKAEAAQAEERLAKQTAAWEASRVDLVGTIARLEASAVTAEKARTFLGQKNKELYRAVAAAEAERADLARKLAAAGDGHGPAPAAIKAEDVKSESAAPGSIAPQSEHNTGGLSALVSLWNTAATMRPFKRKAAVEEEEDPQGAKAPVLDVPAEADPPASQGESGPVRPEEGKPDPVSKESGGLSALVNLWTTSKMQRPRSQPAGKRSPPSTPSPEPVFGIEEIPAVRPAPSGVDVDGQKTQFATSDRPSPLTPERPKSRERPAPKPKPVATRDDTEELSGWLSGLAKRLRGQK